MSQSKFLDLLKSGPLLADGAMGTMLHARGFGFDQCFDGLNLTHPEAVAEVHREYLDAGAQLILSNTFGSNRYKLARHGLAGRLAEVNRAGVQLVKNLVAGSSREIFVAGDIGPLGVRIAPFGRVQLEEARQAFVEQVRSLVEAGADLVVIETMSDLYEIREAIRAARAVTDLPVVASVTFTRDDFTVLGDSPDRVARVIHEAGADVIGVNCSGGPAQLLRILRQMRQAVPDELFWVKPNAGWPEQVGGRIMYPADPEYFGDYALAFCQAGASVVGGCCGTTPAHIASMRKALDKYPGDCSVPVVEFAPPVEVDDHQSLRATSSRLAQKLSSGKFVIAVEVDPPRGLSTHKLIAGASLLQDAGADVVDVADSPLARMRMSAWAVCDVVQHQVGVETTLHFPTRGRNLLRVQGDLLAAHALDIRNVFVVMGDPTSIGDYPEAADNYDIVPTGLIKLIKQGFNTGVDHSGASIGQPTNFFVGAALNLNAADIGQETRRLRRKVQAGADFFLTQPIYEPEVARKFMKQYESEYPRLEQPVLVGILPLYSVRHANFLHHEVPGIAIPETMRRRMEKAGEESVKEGIRITVELVEQLKSWAGGIYLMPQFNRYDVVADIVEAVK